MALITKTVVGTVHNKLVFGDLWKSQYFRGVIVAVLGNCHMRIGKRSYVPDTMATKSIIQLLFSMVSCTLKSTEKLSYGMSLVTVVDIVFSNEIPIWKEVRGTFRVNQEPWAVNEACVIDPFYVEVGPNNKQNTCFRLHSIMEKSIMGHEGTIIENTVELKNNYQSVTHKDGFVIVEALFGVIAVNCKTKTASFISTPFPVDAVPFGKAFIFIDPITNTLALLQPKTLVVSHFVLPKKVALSKDTTDTFGDYYNTMFITLLSKKKDGDTHCCEMSAYCVQFQEGGTPCIGEYALHDLDVVPIIKGGLILCTRTTGIKKEIVVYAPPTMHHTNVVGILEPTIIQYELCGHHPMQFSKVFDNVVGVWCTLPNCIKTKYILWIIRDAQGGITRTTTCTESGITCGVTALDKTFGLVRVTYSGRAGAIIVHVYTGKIIATADISNYSPFLSNT
jgi:hypothetical protein